MKATFTTILILLALCVGWFLGKQDRSPVEEKPEVAKQTSTRSVSPRGRKSVAQPALITSGSNRVFLASLNESLSGTSIDEIKELKSELKSRSWSDWGQRQMAFNLLYERWAELDPEGAMASALTDDLWQQESAFRSILTFVAETDPTEAWHLAQSVEASTSRKNSIEAALGAIARVNPQVALQNYLAAPDGIDPSGLFNTWARNDPKSALAATNSIKTSKRSQIVAGIYSEWFRQDRESALAGAGDLPLYEKRLAIGRIANTWATLDPEKAAEFAAAQSELFGNEQKQSFTRALAQNNPALAIEWATENTTGETRNNALGTAFEFWIGREPEKALAWIQSVPDKHDVPSILQQSFWRLAYQAPEEAMALVETIGEGNFNEWTLNNAVTQIAELDVQRALTMASSLTAPDLRKNSIGQTLRIWARGEPEKALAYAKNESDPALRANFISSVLGTLADQNPQDAFRRAESLTDPQAKLASLKRVFSSWAYQDPKSAADEALKFENPIHREAVLGNVLRRWENGPEASKFILSLEPSEATEKSIDDAAENWGRVNPTEAFDHALTLPDNSVSRQFLSGVLESWAERDPAAAAAALSKGNLAITQPDHYEKVASEWVGDDPEATAKWAGEIADSKGQEKAFETITRRWADQNPEAAAGWLNTLPEGAPRDQAFKTYSEKMLSADPQTAIDWAQSIGNEGRRWDATKNLLKTWHGRDPGSVQDWVDSNGLTPEQLREVFESE